MTGRFEDAAARGWSIAAKRVGTLHLVRRPRGEGAIELVRALGEEERDALLAAYGMGAQQPEDVQTRPDNTDTVGPNETSDASDALAFLRRARDQEHWIACGCAQREGRRPFLIPVRIAHSERVTIRRAEEGHLPHDEACPFFIDVADALRLYQRHDRSCRRPLAPPGFVAFRDAADTDDTKEDATPALRTGRYAEVGYESRPRLATRLFWLLDAAGVNRLQPSAWKAAVRGKPGWEREQYRAVERVAQTTLVAGNISLYQTLYTRLSQYHQHEGKLAFLRWPRGIPAQGYFLGICRDVADTRLLFAAENGSEIALPVKDSLVKWGPRHSVVQPPYVFLATVARDPEDPARFALRSAYVHPVLDAQTLVPVDSDLERQTLLQLIEIGSWLERKKGVSLRIVKPLFNLHVPAEHADVDEDALSAPCRPDFIIEVNGKPFLSIESMGRNDVEYLLRKSVTHPRMARIAPVVTHETWRFATEDRDALNEQFRRIVAARILA